MIHAAIGAVTSLDADALEFVVANRMAAAKAFRVLRDARTLTVEAKVDFVVRGPEGALFAAFSHPGPWAVSLEPQVAVVDAAGGWVSGPRRLADDLAPLLAFFEAHPRINVLARGRTPHLAAWAGLGRAFIFDYRGRPRLLRVDGPAESADGLLGEDQVSVWSEGDLADAAELLAVAEQSAQIRALTQAFAARS